MPLCVMEKCSISDSYVYSGATLCKCLNRGFATFLAGGLGLGAQHLASLCGEKGEPIFLGVFVFLMGNYSFQNILYKFPH